MAKCVNSVVQWTPKEDSKLVLDIKDDTRAGELVLNQHLDLVNRVCLDVTNHFNQIKQSASNLDDKWDCSQVQDCLTSRLELLYSTIDSITKKICTLDCSTATKHRYFIHFSCGTISNLQQLLQMTGRLSDLDQKLYYEEQLKPLISEQSITIHSMNSIWTATISIMQSFSDAIKELFKEQLEQDEYSYIEDLDFASAGRKYAKIFLMDMIFLSWVKFNRLVKLDDLITSSPFLCPCNKRVFINTLQISSKEDCSDKSFSLSEMLPYVMDYSVKSQMLAFGSRNHEIAPLEPHYAEADKQSRAYFVSWYLFALLHALKNSNHSDLLKNCTPMMDSCLKIVLKQAVDSVKSTSQASAAPSSPQNSTIILSPHQEERFKFLFVIIDAWVEKFSKEGIPLLNRMLDVFDQNWPTFGDKYFDETGFRIQGLTVFQLLTKLTNHLIPPVAVDTDQMPTKPEEALRSVWSKLLNRIKPPQIVSNDKNCPAMAASVKPQQSAPGDANISNTSSGITTRTRSRNK